MKKLYMILFIGALFFVGCSHQVPGYVGEMSYYENKEYGFSFNYPEIWHLIEMPNQEIFGENTKLILISPQRMSQIEETEGYEMAWADIYISIFKSSSDLPGNKDAKLNLEEWLTIDGAGQGFMDIQKIRFAGSQAFRVFSSSANEADPEIYVEHDSRIYVIRSEIGSEMQRSQNEQIIQTFEWVN